MASTSAMYTALSGMTANARSLDVIGNNIANSNTTAFKSNRMLFSSAFMRTLSLGTPPGDVSGGTNPIQIGLGVTVGGTQRDFASGTISVTGNAHDLAVEGKGLFVIEREDGRAYTRNGAFAQNAENDLVTADGDRVLGFGVDANFDIVDGDVVALNIPLGTLSLAEATETVRMSGNVDAAGPVASRGALVRILGTGTDGLRAIATAAPPPSGGDLLAPDTRLVDVEDPDLPASGTPLFSAGQSLRLTEAEKGGRLIPTADLAIDDSTTVADLLAFLSDAIGIHTDSGDNPDGAAPGVTLDGATGIISIVGNTGTINDLDIAISDLRLLDDQGAYVRSPFTVEKGGAADGESVRTTFVAHDSLGNMVEVDVGMVLTGTSNQGTTWTYFLDSTDNTGDSPAIGNGTLLFGTDGQLTTRDPISVRVGRDSTGALDPMVFDLYLAGDTDNITALASDGSEIAATYRDGAPLGTLSAFAVGEDGTISGTFSNGLSRTLGQVALATFANVEGLIDVGAGVFAAGPNSGTAAVTAPGTLGAGRLVAGSLEQSNVDLSEEFIGMILASTGYSASSRVIQTSSELVRQLINLGS